MNCATSTEQQPFQPWQFFTLAPGTKFHFLLNDKPSRDGAWEVVITPVSNTDFGNLQYARWVQDRKDIVARLGNGEYAPPVQKLLSGT